MVILEGYYHGCTGVILSPGLGESAVWNMRCTRRGDEDGVVILKVTEIPNRYMEKIE